MRKEHMSNICVRNLIMNIKDHRYPLRKKYKIRYVFELTEKAKTLTKVYKLERERDKKKNKHPFVFVVDVNVK
jgi:hypothetical protein